jgi:hypothetical protein
MVEWRQQVAALCERPDSVQAHGVEAFEDVSVLAVLRRMAVLLDEALDVLEARDDPLLARRPARLLLGWREFRQCFGEFVEVGGQA